MIKELSIYELPENIKVSFVHWKSIFNRSMKGLNLNSLNWKGGDKNLLAFNDDQSFKEWFCYHPINPEPYRDFGFYIREFTALSDFINPSLIVEFGTSLGMGVFMLSKLNPEAKIYSVDNQDKTKMPGDLSVPIGHISKLNNIPCEYVHMKSYEFELNEKVDLCFIDGDHSGDTVWKDSLWAWEHKSDNFVIIWHDYRKGHPSFEGLINSVNRFSSHVNRDVFLLKDSGTAWMI